VDFRNPLRLRSSACSRSLQYIRALRLAGYPIPGPARARVERPRRAPAAIQKSGGPRRAGRTRAAIRPGVRRLQSRTAPSAADWSRRDRCDPRWGFPNGRCACAGASGRGAGGQGRSSLTSK